MNLKDTLLRGTDMGTLLGNGLAFGFGPQLKGGIAALTGGDYATTRDQTQAQIDKARANTGTAGDVAEFVGALAPGGIAVKGLKEVTGLGRAAVSRLTGKAVAEKTGAQAAAEVGKIFGRAAPKISAPAAVAAEQQVGRLAQIANAVGADKLKALTLTPVGKAVAQAAGATSAATAIQNPESDWSKAIGDFAPRIARQYEANGPIGALGAAVGGGLNVGYETVAAPFAGIPAIASQFMRGVADTQEAQTQAQGPAAPTAEEKAAIARQTMAQRAADLAVSERMSTPTKTWNERFPAQAPRPTGKNPWMDSIAVALQNRLAGALKAANGNPELIAKAQNDYLQNSIPFLQPGGAPYMMTDEE